MAEALGLKTELTLHHLYFNVNTSTDRWPFKHSANDDAVEVTRTHKFRMGPTCLSSYIELIFSTVN
jgi:hypothetical protein